ncbi:type 1 glutamine amidotransferase domain-containing protein [Bdellovibrio sp. HCB117]|uniref:type 1 glutamine amidotransferase domain-containing protein n=1 Tax=Bdellovibrio sp. HCB117 TaxID=3394359 RepID=UPI0039B5B9B0
MTPSLKGKNIAILATDGFEESELFEPKKALDDAGAKTTLISLKEGEIKGWAKTNWGKSIKVDLTVEKASPDDYDGLLLPGGVMNPDKLRKESKAVEFTKKFAESGKPIAAICHGPQLLIETGMVKGRRMTSYPSVKTDLKNAGATWEDKEVITDNGLVTSRKPEDIPAFNRKMIEEFAEGRHVQRPGIDASI